MWGVLHQMPTASSILKINFQPGSASSQSYVPVPMSRLCKDCIIGRQHPYEWLQMNSQGQAFGNALSFGAGHINPEAALDPGLGRWPENHSQNLSRRSLHSALISPIRSSNQNGLRFTRHS